MGHRMRSRRLRAIPNRCCNPAIRRRWGGWAKRWLSSIATYVSPRS